MAKMKNTNTVVNSLIDAVVASGKKFVELPQQTIFAFFDKEGVPRAMWDDMYNRAKSAFEPKQKVEQSVKHVDYSDSSHNEVKVRQPRKSVFSDIKKIAG